ncbi:unnamed protein product [Rangifer tarandus platyrhynchus]|uniref:Uncharacterized protein n=1 Tax=Rangifer tarandus platyrhynchus TaxID=3082113 RepID=A0ACB1KE48_RANTA
MHGLIFETSICYWQDQPGRGASTRSRRAGRHRAQERGEGRGGPPSSSSSSSAPHPPRREPARPGGPGSRAGDAPGPGHTGNGRRALKSPSVRPPQRGGGCRAAKTRRPARGGRTGDPTGARESASERGARRGGVLVGGWGGGGGRGSRVLPPSPSPRRRRRTGGGGKAGNGSGPRQARGSEARQGAAPGSSRWGADRGGRADGQRGAPAVCGHVTPTPRNRRWRRGWPRATARGMGSKRPGGSESAARAHRGISPPEASQHRGGPAAHPERQTGLSGHTPHPRGGEGGRTPHGGLTPTATPTPRAAAGPGERSRAAYRQGPHSPHTRNPAVRQRLPPARPVPLSGLRGHCATRGRHRPTEAGRRHPREARPARSQTAGDGGGRGHRRPHARDEEEGRQRCGGAGQHTQQGLRDGGEGAVPGTRKHRDTAGPPGKPARGHTATHARGRSRDAWDAGRLNILGTRSRARRPRPGPPHHHRLWLGGEGGRDRLLLTTAAGLGEPGPTGRRAPTTPFPPGLTPRGRPRAHSTHARPPPTRQTPGGAQRDPPPTRRGEAQAAVGNKRHAAPPRGRRNHHHPPLPTEGRGGGLFCPRALAVATVATAHSGGAASGGSGTPRLPLRSLEKAFSPRARHPPHTHTPPFMLKAPLRIVARTTGDRAEADKPRAGGGGRRRGKASGPPRRGAANPSRRTARDTRPEDPHPAVRGRLHSWWCPSVNSFKFQLCNHTPPGTQRLWFPGSCPAGHGNNAAASPVGIVYGRNYDARRPPPRAGTRGGARRAPLLLLLLLRTPPSPSRARPPRRPREPGRGRPRARPHRERPTRPQEPVRPPAPEGRGMPGGEDTATGPRWADRGPDRRSGERVGAGGAAGGSVPDRGGRGRRPRRGAARNRGPGGAPGGGDRRARRRGPRGAAGRRGCGAARGRRRGGGRGGGGGGSPPPRPGARAPPPTAGGRTHAPHAPRPRARGGGAPAPAGLPGGGRDARRSWGDPREGPGSRPESPPPPAPRVPGPPRGDRPRHRGPGRSRPRPPRSRRPPTRPPRRGEAGGREESGGRAVPEPVAAHRRGGNAPGGARSPAGGRSPADPTPGPARPPPRPPRRPPPPGDGGTSGEGRREGGPRPRGRGARAAARPQPGGRARSGGQTPRRPAGRRRGTRPRGADAHTGSASGASRPPRQGESHGGRPGSGHGPRTRGRGRKAPQRRGGGGGGGAGPAGRRGNTARQGQGSERRRTGDATPHTPPNQPRGAPQPRHEARDRPQPPTTPQGPTPPEGRLRREGALEGGKDTDHGRPVASARAQIPFSPPHRRGTPPATEAGGTPRPGGSHPPPGRRAGGRAHAPHTATAHTTTAGYLERGRRARGTARPTGHRPDVGHQPPHPPHTRGRPRASALPARGARGPHRAPVRPRPGGSPRRRQATNPPTHPPETGQSPPRPPPQLAHPHGRPPPRDPARSSGRPATGPRQTSPGPAAAGGDGARRAAPHDGEPPTRHAAQPATRDRRTRTLRSAAGGGRKAAVAGATGEGSPTETLLRLLLPLDSQVRPSSQRSARAVGRPRRGRSEGLTKPSNRHSDYHRKLIGQTFEWVVAATGGVRSARGYLESPKPPAPAPRPGPGGG